MEIQLTLPASAKEEFLYQFIQEVKADIRREIEAEQKPMCQKDLMAYFGWDNNYMKMLVRKGLRRRKQGKSWMYDLADVYETLELLKQ